MTPLLPPAFYRRDAVTVARELVGTWLVRGEVVLEITEVEAYPPGDTAAHTRHGRTARNAPMWGPPGRVYVYLCYGMHQMLNIVTGEDGVGEAVLVRAAEPVAGLALIQERRRGVTGPALLTGPGKVGQALALDGSECNATLYTEGGLELRVGRGPAPLLVGPRVGIDYASAEDRAAPWRFARAGTPWVTQRRSLRPWPG